MGKTAVFCSLIASAAAFSQQDTRRDALAGIAAAGAALIPAAANAAAGESPRFSVFGLIGDGTSYSEGAAYGSDQGAKTYSPYSVYSEFSEKSVYKPDGAEYAERKKKILAESKKRLAKLDRYIQRKEWFNVIDELDRYMYETRGAVKGLAKTPEQKALQKQFVAAIEDTNLAARLKKQEACAAAAKEAQTKLDEFAATI